MTVSEYRKLIKSGQIKPKDQSGCKKGRAKDQDHVKTLDRSLKGFKIVRCKYKSKIENDLKTAGVEFVKELQFAKPRKFRFDFALPKIMIAIEYEGIVSKKSRHTSLTGFTNDCEKYNLAQSLGWKVYRYTALNIRQLQTLIKSIHEQEKGK